MKAKKTRIRKSEINSCPPDQYKAILLDIFFNPPNPLSPDIKKLLQPWIEIIGSKVRDKLQDWDETGKKLYNKIKEEIIEVCEELTIIRKCEGIVDYVLLYLLQSCKVSFFRV